MAEIKVKDLPIQNAPLLTDFAITDKALGTDTEKTTWQNIKDLFGSGASVKVGGVLTRDAGQGSGNQVIAIPSQPAKSVKAVWIIAGEIGIDDVHSNGFCSPTAEAVPPPSFFQANTNTDNGYDADNCVHVSQMGNGFTGAISGLGVGAFIIDWVQVGLGKNIEVTYMVEME